MKKLLIALLICTLTVCGCSVDGTDTVEDTETVSYPVLFEFELVGCTNFSNHVRIWAHKETGVCYMVDSGRITVMLDSDGKPLIYEKDD